MDQVDVFLPVDLFSTLRTAAVPYDFDGTEFAHEGERCSFDAILHFHKRLAVPPPMPKAPT